MFECEKYNLLTWVITNNIRNSKGEIKTNKDLFFFKIKHFSGQNCEALSI